MPTTWPSAPATCWTSPSNHLPSAVCALQMYGSCSIQAALLPTTWPSAPATCLTSPTWCAGSCPTRTAPRWARSSPSTCTPGTWCRYGLVNARDPGVGDEIIRKCRPSSNFNELNGCTSPPCTCAFQTWCPCCFLSHHLPTSTPVTATRAGAGGCQDPVAHRL